MERLVDEGWQLEKWRYCWRLVGLTWMEENFINKMQPETGFLDSGVKEILFKETHE